MDIKKLISKALTRVCIYFTVITAVYMLILQFMNISDDATAVQAFRVLLFFLFSVLFAIANAIRSIEKLNGVLRYLFHYAITAFGLYTCFMLPVEMRPSFVVTGLIIFTVIYVAVFGIAAIFKARLRSKREQAGEYSGQFNIKKQ